MSTNALFMTFIYLKIWCTNSTKCVLKVKRDSIIIARSITKYKCIVNISDIASIRPFRVSSII